MSAEPCNTYAVDEPHSTRSDTMSAAAPLEPGAVADAIQAIVDAYTDKLHFSAHLALGEARYTLRTLQLILDRTDGAPRQRDEHDACQFCMCDPCQGAGCSSLVGAA